MKIENPATCEDCLAFLVQSGKMESTDKTILKSIHRQVSRKTAMTDRQYALVKQKLLTYGRLWQDNDIDINKYVDVLKYPLREIDRSHWIKILRYKEEDVLGIRFPFNKKVIDRVEELRRLNEINIRAHSYQDNVHCFPLTPQNVFKLVDIASRFESKFSIHQEVLDTYNQLLVFENNKNQYLPGVYDYEVKNIPDIAIKNLKDSLGEVDEDNLALYYERRYLYGFVEFDKLPLQHSISKFSTLAQNIIKREQSVVLVNNKSVNLNDLISAITEVNRLPIIIALKNNDAHDQLFELHNIFKHIIPTEQMTVLFRKDGSDPFNDYVRNQGLNNKVDNNTKIVYISSNKLPKPLLQSDWTANCSLSFDSSKLTRNHVTDYFEAFDLRIVYDEIATGGHWNRSERKYIHGYM